VEDTIQLSRILRTVVGECFDEADPAVAAVGDGGQWAAGRGCLGLLFLPLGFIPQEIRLVVLLLMAAPSAAMCTLQCQKHSMNDAYASHIFAVTTLVSMLTMPLVVKLFTWAAEKF